MENETDFCDRIPGCHTGRLSLELQSKEQAEWQRRITELELMLVAAVDTIRRLTTPASPAPISPEVPQAHGTATLAIEALNVIEQWAASGKLDADSLEEAVHVLADIESKAAALLNELTPATQSAAAVGPTGQEIRSLWMRLLGHTTEEIAASPPVVDVAEELRQLKAAIELNGTAPSAAVGKMSEHQLRAIGKAASALRFSASQNDWHTEASANELRQIANTLTGIEIDAAATPSAAVGASEPVAGDHKEWCDGAKEFCERQNEPDTVPRAEYDRVVKLNHHLREVAVMAIVERDVEIGFTDRTAVVEVPE